MQSFRQPSANQRPNVSISMPVSVEFAVSLGTLPVLMLLTGGHALTNGLRQLGQTSEELFRGDRLPNRPLLRRPLPEVERDA